jgi:hypothetical protein
MPLVPGRPFVPILFQAHTTMTASMEHALTFVEERQRKKTNIMPINNSIF